MAKKNPKSPVLAALRKATLSEDAAVAFIENARWGDTPACPRCGSTNVYQMQDRATGKREKNYRWRCRDCKQRHTVRTGAIFEETRLPLRVWCYAMWKACSSKKGVSALQISRECEITHKSALFLMHRIRYAMADLDAKPLGGPGKTVEADETWVGGKPRNRRLGRQGWTAKTPVAALVERGGDVRIQPLGRVTAKQLGAFLAVHADPESRLMTDQHQGYKTLGKGFAGGHEAVNHQAGEYARGVAHNNTAESVFSLLKRGLMGTFHSVSKHHLWRYLDEFCYRWNTRGVDDDERVLRLLRKVEGRRLIYARPSSP